MNEHYMEGPEGLQRLMDAVTSGEITAKEALAILSDILIPSSNARDCTNEYKAALHALCQPRLADALDSVRIRLGDGVVSIGYAVRKDMGLDLNELDATESEAMSLALLATLRGHDINARREDDGTIVFTPDRDNGASFAETIKSFVEEIDETLGPSVPEPGDSRWKRWL